MCLMFYEGGFSEGVVGKIKGVGVVEWLHRPARMVIVGDN